MNLTRCEIHNMAHSKSESCLICDYYAHKDLMQMDEEACNFDVIKKPVHYAQGIECWDFITSHKMSYLEGNIIKYVTRYKSKNGREDLLKAQAYLEKLLKETK